MRGATTIGIGALLLAAAMPMAADAQYRGGYDYGRGGYADGYRGAPPPPPGYYDGPGYRGGPGYGRGHRGGYRGSRRCDRGTGGTIIGAIAGGLLGNGIAGRGDRTVGTVVGAGVGALAGRAIDRDC